MTFLLLVMVIIFIAGFFIDFIEIIFIFVIHFPIHVGISHKVTEFSCIRIEFFRKICSVYYPICI